MAGLSLGSPFCCITEVVISHSPVPESYLETDLCSWGWHFLHRSPRPRSVGCRLPAFHAVAQVIRSRVKKGGCRPAAGLRWADRLANFHTSNDPKRQNGRTRWPPPLPPATFQPPTEVLRPDVVSMTDHPGTSPVDRLEDLQQGLEGLAVVLTHLAPGLRPTASP